MTIQNTKQKRILAVCYGDGHVFMLMPVPKIFKSLRYDVQLLGLTTAAEALSKLKKDTITMQNQRGVEIRKAWNCDGHSHFRIADVVVQALQSSTQSKAA